MTNVLVTGDAGFTGANFIRHLLRVDDGIHVINPDALTSLHPGPAQPAPRDRPGHDCRYAMNITKIKTELGWQPRRSLAIGLREAVHWYLDHADWLAAIEQQRWVNANYAARETAER